MKRIVAVALVLCACTVVLARERKLPVGEAANESASVSATVFDAEQLRQAVGSDFKNDYIVIEVTVHPKTSGPYAIRLDDFVLRSEMSADHSGPLLAGQIAGTGMLVVKTEDPGGKRKGGFSAGIGGGMIGSGNVGGVETTTSEMKDGTAGSSLLDVLKEKILVEKPTSTPVTGLLFFPLDSKEKSKYLNLLCTTPGGVLRIKFK